MLPPTLYFFIAFNLIVFTTNLLVHDYWFRASSFLVATMTALVVGKSVLVANQIKLIDRFRGAPLIQPIRLAGRSRWRVGSVFTPCRDTVAPPTPGACRLMKRSPAEAS